MRYRDRHGCVQDKPFLSLSDCGNLLAFAPAVSHPSVTRCRGSRRRCSRRAARQGVENAGSGIDWERKLLFEHHLSPAPVLISLRHSTARRVDDRRRGDGKYVTGSREGSALKVIAKSLSPFAWVLYRLTYYTASRSIRANTSDGARPYGEPKYVDLISRAHRDQARRQFPSNLDYWVLHGVVMTNARSMRCLERRRASPKHAHPTRRISPLRSGRDRGSGLNCRAVARETGEKNLCSPVAWRSIACQWKLQKKGWS